MSESKSTIYNLLRGLEGEALQQAIGLISLAGQVGGMANGYFFDQQSLDRVNALDATKFTFDEQMRLFDLQRELLNSLRRRPDAAEEYRLFTDLIGAEKMTSEEIMAAVEKNLSGKSSS